MHLDLLFPINHNFRLPLVILDCSGHTDGFTIVGFINHIREDPPLVKHDHSPKWVIWVIASHVQESGSVVQSLVTVHTFTHIVTVSPM